MIVLFLSLSCIGQIGKSNTTIKASGSMDTTAKSVIQLSVDSVLRISNLLSNQKDSAKINEIIAVKLSTQKSIATFNTLYIDGIKVEGLKPWKSSECDKTVFFKLDKNVENLLLQFIEREATDKTIIEANFSVGTEKACLASFSDPIYIEVKQTIKAVWVWLMVGVFLVLIGFAIMQNVLKDDNNLYYSLGRTQLFFWTILFVIAYLFICLKTGALPEIPNAILVILGISIATTATSKVIENASNQVALDPTAKSQGWFLDILSDGSSINIQRFQNVVFMLMFGIIFLQKTFSTCLMPDFDNNVLLLLGISSGTYAGMKLTEEKKPQIDPPAENGNMPPV